MATKSDFIITAYALLANRAPEAEGYNYFLDKTDEEIIDTFLNHWWTRFLFGGSWQGNREFIEWIYSSGFQKQEKEGEDYWVGKLDGGQDRRSLMIEMIYVALDDYVNKGSTERGSNILRNKLELGRYTIERFFKIPYEVTCRWDVLNYTNGGLYVDEDPASVETAKRCIDRIVDKMNACDTKCC